MRFEVVRGYKRHYWRPDGGLSDSLVGEGEVVRRHALDGEYQRRHARRVVASCISFVKQSAQRSEF